MTPNKFPNTIRGRREFEKNLSKIQLIQHTANGKNFYQQWNIPKCIGAIDGKHVNIQALPNSRSSLIIKNKTAL